MMGILDPRYVLNHILQRIMAGESATSALDLGELQAAFGKCSWKMPTPDEMEAAQGDVAALADLLARGADLTRDDLLRAAAENKGYALARLLIRGGSNLHDPHGIAQIVRNDSSAMLMLFLYEGMDPNCAWSSFPDDRILARTPLTLACRHNAYDCVRVLLDFGADPNIPCPFRTDYPLHIAIGQKSEQMLLWTLLNHGANINARTASGETPLYRACSRFMKNPENAHLVRTLLEQGADPNIATEEGYTPLMQAAGANDNRLLTLLLEHGADADRQDRNGHTALWYAEHRGHKAVVLQLGNLQRVHRAISSVNAV